MDPQPHRGRARRGILNRLDNATRSRLRETVRAAVAPYEADGALELPGLAVVVTGRRP